MNFSKHLKKNLIEMGEYYKNTNFYFISENIDILLKLNTRLEVCQIIEKLKYIMWDLYNSVEGGIKYSDYRFIKRLYMSVVVNGKYYYDKSK